jgi:hypothetical protein
VANFSDYPPETPLVHGVRMLAIKDFENYLLFYLEHEDCVDVIRVLHGARDMRSPSNFNALLIRLVPLARPSPTAAVQDYLRL